MKKLSILIPALLLMIGCKEEKKEVAQYQIIEVSEDFPLLKNDSKHKFHVEFTMPLLTNYTEKSIIENVNFELNKFFFGDEGIYINKNPKENFKRYVSSLSIAYPKETGFSKNKLKDYTTMNYRLVKRGRIVYNKHKILSIFCNVYDYSGGAHGIDAISILHFDMNTGLPFNLDDLVAKEKKPELGKLIAAKCEEMKKAKDSKLFEDAEIESFDNFYFDDNNFYFVYQPYELAPYSAGIVSIDIPISDIKPLLKVDIDPGFL